MMLWLLLVLSALAGPGLLPASAVNPRVFDGQGFALLVGPEGFDDPGFPDLRYTDDDARDLGRTLQQRGDFGHVWTLTQDSSL